MRAIIVLTALVTSCALTCAAQTQNPPPTPVDVEVRAAFIPLPSSMAFKGDSAEFFEAGARVEQLVSFLGDTCVSDFKLITCTAPDTAGYYILHVATYNLATQEYVPDLSSRTYACVVAKSDTAYLFPASPNPVTDSVLLAFYLPRAGCVSLTIRNVLGQLACIPLPETELPPGVHGIGAALHPYSSGIYFYTLIVDGVAEDTEKLVHTN